MKEKHDSEDSVLMVFEDDVVEEFDENDVDDNDIDDDNEKLLFNGSEKGSRRVF